MNSFIITGCNKYSTRIVSTQDKFDLKYYYNDVKQQKDKTFMFTGNFFIDHPLNIFFGAKIRFYEFNDRPGDYYEIGKSFVYLIVIISTTIFITLNIFEFSSHGCLCHYLPVCIF